MTRERGRIDFGKLDDSQIAFLESTPWHLEAWYGDGERLRVVYPEIGMTSRWFSSEWKPVPYEFIRPHKPIRT